MYVTLPLPRLSTLIVTVPTAFLITRSVPNVVIVVVNRVDVNEC